MDKETRSFVGKIVAVIIALVVAVGIYAALKASPMGSQVGAAVVNKAFDVYTALPYMLAAGLAGYLYGAKKSKA